MMTFMKSSIFKALCLVFIAWGVLFYSSIESAVAIWYRSETFAHCFIILPICIYLIKQKWAELNNAHFKPSLTPLVFIFGVLAMWLFGSLAQVLVIEQAAAFAMLPLMIWCLLGNQIARILLFVSFFWMFSVPMGEFMIPALQELTADITVVALQLTGIPVYREGLYIAVPGGLFEVAVACSGIRYLIASFTLGTLFAYLNYNGPKKRAIFILFSIILPLIANGIRAYGIVMIAHLSDMKYATGVDHLIYGWVFFGVVILVMFTLGGRWADPMPDEVKQVQPNGPAFNVKPLVMPGVAMLVILISGLTYKAVFENQVSGFTPQISQVFSAQRPISDNSWLPIFQNPTQEIVAQDDGFDYYFAYYNANIQGQELINGSHKMYNIERWSIVSQQANDRYRTLEIIDNFGRKRLISYTYVTPWHITHRSLEIKLVQAVQALLGQPQTGFVLMISVAENSAEADKQRLQQKADALFTPALRDLLNEQ